jgi:hypothetical protein
MKRLNHSQYDWLVSLITHVNCVSYCDDYDRQLIRRVLGNGMYDISDANVLNGISTHYRLKKYQYGHIGKY